MLQVFAKCSSFVDKAITLANFQFLRYNVWKRCCRTFAFETNPHFVLDGKSRFH